MIWGSGRPILIENSSAIKKFPPGSELCLRQAMRGDARLIRKLIYRVGINPTGLDWRRFWVVTEKYSGLIACGQIKPHRDGSRELASIAVAPDWRGLGLATLVIEKLLSQAPAPIFLTCRVNLGAFYRRFGFYSLSRMEDMPPYFRLVWRLVNAIRSISPRAGELLVMRRD